MVTFKDVIDSFESFSNSHPQINSFLWGNLSDINPSDTIMPLVFLNPIISTKREMFSF